MLPRMNHLPKFERVRAGHEELSQSRTEPSRGAARPSQAEPSDSAPDEVAFAEACYTNLCSNSLVDYVTAFCDHLILHGVPLNV
jgi:hypothetical protein